MGVSITKDQAGVDALNKFADSILQSQEDVSKAMDSLMATYQGLKNDIAHEKDVDEIQEDVLTTLADSATAFATLANKMHSIAKKLEEFLSAKLGGN